MEKCFDEGAIDIFREPARIIVNGSSNTGKTELINKIIKKYYLRFSHIVICGTSEHPLQSDPLIAKRLYVHPEIIDPLSDVDYTSQPYSVLFIIDDLFTEAVGNKIVVDAFTKGRHKHISTILISQNMFYGGKFARSISLNASHFILLRTRDVSQIEVLGRQIFGREAGKSLVSLYKKIVLGKPFSYLLIDLALNTPPELQLRTNIVHEAPWEIAYVEWEK